MELRGSFVPMGLDQTPASSIFTAVQQQDYSAGVWLRRKDKLEHEVPRAVLTLLPNSTELFYGQNATLRCDIKGGEVADNWMYKWFKDRESGGVPLHSSTGNKYIIQLDTRFQSAGFRCMGIRKRDSQNSSISEVVQLRVSVIPATVLSVSPSWWAKAGDSVTLSCGVKGSSSTDWSFHWYRVVPYTAGLSSPEHRGFSVEPLTDSQRGAGGSYNLSSVGLDHMGSYVCRGESRTPGIYTYYSPPKIIFVVGASPLAYLRVRPNRTVHFQGETLSISCEREGDLNTTIWKVKRLTSTSLSECGANWGSPMGPTCNISKMLSYSDSGVYWCESGSGERSNAINITLGEKPNTVITASPTWWPNIGDSVNLTCQVDISSTGWSFYWYKAVFFTMMPLADSQLGAGGSYSLGPVSLNHTGVYNCRAGRKESAYYAEYSPSQILWVVGPSPLASLSICPNRSQHFAGQDFFLKCEGKEEGNATSWRVRKILTWSEAPGECGDEWGIAEGSACSVENIYSESEDGVYWCESGSGERSAAINITVALEGVILDSPALPVTEGDNVTLRCQYERTPSDVSAEFYKEGSGVVGADGTGEMTIYHVSRSDAGYYWCKNPDRGESPKSWVAVEVPSPPPVDGSLVVSRLLWFMPFLLLAIYLLVRRRRAPALLPQGDDRVHAYEEIELT